MHPCLYVRTYVPACWHNYVWYIYAYVRTFCFICLLGIEYVYGVGYADEFSDA